MLINSRFSSLLFCTLKRTYLILYVFGCKICINSLLGMILYKIFSCTCFTLNQTNSIGAKGRKLFKFKFCKVFSKKEKNFWFYKEETFLSVSSHSTVLLLFSTREQKAEPSKKDCQPTTTFPSLFQLINQLSLLLPSTNKRLLLRSLMLFFFRKYPAKVAVIFSLSICLFACCFLFIVCLHQ